MSKANNINFAVLCISSYPVNLSKFLVLLPGTEMDKYTV